MIDCIVVGAGHNGLVTAAYLARSGYSVLVLEANSSVGGAAVSAEVFPGMGARVSKYSYLVSLLPPAIARDLAIDVPLARRRVASYRRTARQTSDDAGAHAAAPATRRASHRGSLREWPVHHERAR
ncbi:MAG: FAD-dependent oxidoreductase, partial [Actinomycetota bacterium]